MNTSTNIFIYWYIYIFAYLHIQVHIYIHLTRIHIYIFIGILIYMYLEHGSPVIVTPLRNQGDGGSVAPGMEEVPRMETRAFGGCFFSKGIATEKERYRCPMILMCVFVWSISIET